MHAIMQFRNLTLSLTYFKNLLLYKHPLETPYYRLNLVVVFEFTALESYLKNIVTDFIILDGVIIASSIKLINNHLFCHHDRKRFSTENIRYNDNNLLYGYNYKFLFVPPRPC